MAKLLHIVMLHGIDQVGTMAICSMKVQAAQVYCPSILVSHANSESNDHHDVMLRTHPLGAHLTTLAPTPSLLGHSQCLNKHPSNL